MVDCVNLQETKSAIQIVVHLCSPGRTHLDIPLLCHVGCFELILLQYDFATAV